MTAEEPLPHFIPFPAEGFIATRAGLKLTQGMAADVGLAYESVIRGLHQTNGQPRSRYDLLVPPVEVLEAELRVLEIAWDAMGWDND